MLNKEIDVLIVSGSENRFSYLTTTLGCLIPNAPYLRIHVALQYEPNILQQKHFDILADVAEQYNSKLTITMYEKPAPLAYVKAHMISHVFNRKWVLFLDDDVMFSKKAIMNLLKQVEEMQNYCSYFVVEFVDVNGSRKHEDWDLHKRFISEYLDEEKIIHHRWHSAVVPINFGGSIFIAKRNELERNGSIEAMQLMKKGERGYDIIVSSKFESKIGVLGETFWHCGLDESFFGKDWTSVSNVALDLIYDKKKRMEK